MIDAAIDKGVSARPSESRRRRARRRDAAGPILTVVCLLVGLFLFGAGEPKSALFVSGCLVVAALLAVALAGPRHVTTGMLAVSVTLVAWGASSLAGPFAQAMPELATLFAGGAVWCVGYLAARRRVDTSVLLGGLIWTSLAYCIWYFFGEVSDGVNLLGAISDPTSASVLFGLFTLIGASRVLHVMKMVDAEALSRSEAIDRLMRDGLGGLLLLGFALTCLLMAGTRTGVLFAMSALILHVWWDLRGLVRRDHPGGLLRLASGLAPVVAVALAAWGVATCYLESDSGARNFDTGRLLHLDRLAAYASAWLERPFLGHGLGSMDEVTGRVMTLWNADALLDRGGTQNVALHWLVEVGAVGLIVLLGLVIAMYVRIASTFGQKRLPRTLPRLAIVSGVLLLLHGLTDSSLDLPSIGWLYALLLGAACGVASKAQKRAQDRLL